jgi:hypothetical protein
MRDFELQLGEGDEVLRRRRRRKGRWMTLEAALR